MADQGKRTLAAGKRRKVLVGNSDDQLIPSASLKGEILVPYQVHSSISLKPRVAHSLKNRLNTVIGATGDLLQQERCHSKIRCPLSVFSVCR